jgi:hypothetical protein
MILVIASVLLYPDSSFAFNQCLIFALSHAQD